MALLEPGDLAWLQQRPPLYRHADWLFCHADSRIYLSLGQNLEAVQERAWTLLQATNSESWIEFLNAFSEREMFLGRQGQEQVLEMLRVFGGKKLAHGHTPVFVLQEMTASPSLAPYLYADGRALALDSAMAYQKGAGFIVRLESDPGRLERPESGVLETQFMTDILVTSL